MDQKHEEKVVSLTPLSQSEKHISGFGFFFYFELK